jgi:hypothetical protein
MASNTRASNISRTKKEGCFGFCFFGLIISHKHNWKQTRRARSDQPQGQVDAEWRLQIAAMNVSRIVPQQLSHAPKGVWTPGAA